MKKLIENGIVVSIGNHKEDIVNSNITSLVATCIHKKWDEKIRIVVVDCYEHKGYLYNQRELELEIAKEDYRPPFRLLQISSEHFPKQADFLIDEYDIVFLDLSGNLKQQSIIQCYNLVDVLIVPTKANIFNLQSTIDFLRIHKETIIPTRKKYELKTAIFGLFFGDNAQNKNFKEQYLNEFRNSRPVEFLQNFVSDPELAFQKNITTTSVSEKSDYKNYEDLSKEIVSKIISAARTDVSVDNFNVFAKD